MKLNLKELWSSVSCPVMRKGHYIKLDTKEALPTYTVTNVKFIQILSEIWEENPFQICH